MGKKRCQIVALVGRPNVGKSSLFNRLTKTRKAIVDPTPGVTRDRHYERVDWCGREFILVDTGGVETGAESSMSNLITQQTLMAIEEADIIIFLLDGREGLVAEDYNIIQLLRKSQKPLYCVVNKVDGPELEHQLLPQFYELGQDRLWPLSAAHGYGIDAVLDDLADKIDLEDTGEQVILEDTISLAVIGRPNVGKSSLINRLLGEERMVVSNLPGTTRDAVDAILEQDGKKYQLVDTAGIRRKGKVQEKLEKFSVMRALATMERCDIALLLIDASEGITEQDTKVIGYALERGRACILLINKWDLVARDKKQQKWLMDNIAMATRFVEYAPCLTISALTGYGIKKIFPAIIEVARQYAGRFSTNRLNKILQKAVEGHTPPLHKGRRLKFYYTTQTGTKPPALTIFANYPKGVHFSYYRYLVNQFRAGLGLDKCPVTLYIKERTRKKYG